jgi:hypothetical protein
MSTSELSGPDFLDHIADVESGQGLHINAAEYRKRARQWREHQQQLEAAVLEVDRLTADIAALRQHAFTAVDALSKVAAPTPSTAGAVTA